MPEHDAPSRGQVAAARRRLIVQLLASRTAVTIGDVSRQLEVSPMTVRRDLTALEHAGVISRSHGGAVLRSMRLPGTGARSMPASVPTAQEHAAATAAARSIRAQETIFLDGSRFALIVAERLVQAHRSVRVVTNGLAIASVLARADTPELVAVLAGGRLTAEGAFVGPATERTLRAHYADQALFQQAAADDPDASAITTIMREHARVEVEFRPS